MDSRPICSVEGCDREAKLTGLCGAHYQRLIGKGDVQADIPIRKLDRNKGKRCPVNDCGKPAVKAGLCQSHYDKRRRVWKPRDQQVIRAFVTREQGRYVIQAIDSTIQWYRRNLGAVPGDDPEVFQRRIDELEDARKTMKEAVDAKGHGKRY